MSAIRELTQYPNVKVCEKTSNRSSRKVLSVGALALALQVGTGGYMDIGFLKARGDKGYALPGLEIHSRRSARQNNSANIQTPAQEVSYALDKSGLSTAEFASLFNVSRQAIYDWKAGKSLSPANLQRLSDLSSALNKLEKAGITKSHQALERPIHSGKNFVSLVKEGYSAEEATNKLILILAREQAEKEQLQSLFAGKKMPSSNFFDDMDPPTVESEA